MSTQSPRHSRSLALTLALALAFVVACAGTVSNQVPDKSEPTAAQEQASTAACALEAMSASYSGVLGTYHHSTLAFTEGNTIKIPLPTDISGSGSLLDFAAVVEFVGGPWLPCQLQQGCANSGILDCGYAWSGHAWGFLGCNRVQGPYAPGDTLRNVTSISFALSKTCSCAPNSASATLSNLASTYSTGPCFASSCSPSKGATSTPLTSGTPCQSSSCNAVSTCDGAGICTASATLQRVGGACVVDTDCCDGLYCGAGNVCTSTLTCIDAAGFSCDLHRNICCFQGAGGIELQCGPQGVQGLCCISSHQPCDAANDSCGVCGSACCNGCTDSLCN